MKSNMKKLITSIGYVLAGVIICVFKQEAFKWLFFGFGVLFFVISLIYLIKDVKEGNQTKQYADIIGLVIGVLLMSFAWFWLIFITITAGIILLLYGLYLFTSSFVINTKAYKVATLIDGCLFITAGILLLINSDAIYIILGCVILASGIVGIIASFVNKNIVTSQPNAKNNNEDAIEVEVIEKEIEDA